MYDHQQRLEALNTEHSYIVQAPAGSGKTQLLTQRYLTLLAGVNHPEEVLAVTFTNKAVDELFERVLMALNSTHLNTSDAVHEQQITELAQQVMKRSDDMGWQLLANPQRLKIITWDALSAQIMRQKKNRLIADIQIKSGWEMDTIYQQAVVNTISLIDEPDYQDVIVSVLGYFDNNIDSVIPLMVTMLKKRDQWLRHITDDNKLNADELQASLESIITNHIQQLNGAFATVLDGKFVVVVQTAYPELVPNTLAYWQTLSRVCLTNDGQWRKRLDKRQGFDTTLKAQKEYILAVIDSMRDDDLLKNLLVDTTKLPSIHYDADDWHILQAISVMLKLCAAQLQLIFDEQLISDYIAVNQGAIDALGDNDAPSDLALFLDYKINHILIDEFQDTANTHIILLEKLTQGWQSGDGKTVFIVGDPMQSIYAFREAQVGIFLQVAKYGIGAIPLTMLRLSVNFRSNNALVEGNNALFSTIFPPTERIDLGEIRFSSSSAFDANDTNDTNQTDAAFMFNAFVGDPDDQRQAEHIVSSIQTIRTQYPDDDIAVLVKSRTHLKDIVPLLIANNIEFEGADIQPLDKHWLVCDLLSLISVMVNVSDRLAWLSILRSPWCGLVLADLLSISQHNESVWSGLCDNKAISTLSADAQQRVQHLVSVMQPIIDQRGQFELSYLVMIITQRLTMDAYLTANQITIKRLVIEQLMQLEHRDDFSIDQLKAALAELYTPAMPANVKLMTIHKAKGLEFDHVFLVKLNRQTRREDTEVVLYYENAARHFIAAALRSSIETNNSQTYQHIHHINQQKRAFEQIRLLYVAMTRAKKSVQLFSAVKQDENGDYHTQNNTFLRLLLAPYQQAKLPFVTHSNPHQDSYPQNAPVLERIEQLVAPVSYGEDDEKGEREATSSLLTDDSAKRLGTLVHRYLEHNHRPASERIQYDLMAAGFAESQIDKTAAQIKTMLSNVAGDAAGQWIFKPRENTRTEAAFGYAKGADVGEIVIDRLFIDEGVLWIIDFKTNAMVAGECEADFSERLKRCYQDQLDHYAAILKTLYIQPIKKALYCPIVPVLIELD